MSPQAHWYELTLKKGETLIELTADDAAFMQGQLNHWLTVLSVPGVPAMPVNTSPAPVASSPENTPPEEPLAPVGLAARRAAESEPPELSAPATTEAPKPLSEPAPPVDKPSTKNDWDAAAHANTAAPTKTEEAPPEKIALPGGSEVSTTLTQPSTSDAPTEEPTAAPSSGFSRPSVQRPSASGVRHTSLPEVADDRSDLDKKLDEELEALFIESDPNASPDKPAAKGQLDAESAQALDDLLGSPAGGKSAMGLNEQDDNMPAPPPARVKPHLQGPLTPEEAASISDRGKDTEADEDFERVMSSLMADLQGSPVSDEAASTSSQVTPPEKDDIENALIAGATAEPELSFGANSDVVEDDDESGLVAAPSPIHQDDDDAKAITDDTDTYFDEALDAPLGRPKEAPKPSTAWTPVMSDDNSDASDTTTNAETNSADTPADMPPHEAFATVCDTTGAATPEDHLLISAYVLTVHGKQGRFSLGALNQTITAANEGPVNHTVLETALNKGLLMMVPDLTGTAETTEFELTPHGRGTVETFL